jgi:RNA polymerase sigma-70 factor (ECF subfamily)
LLAVVRNTAMTWLGKNRSASIVAVDDIAAAEQAGANPNWADTPEAAVIAKADGARLAAALAALPTEFREVLLLRDIQGLNYREIADVLGVPMGTVMSRLARARAKLMAAIGERVP